MKVWLVFKITTWYGESVEVVEDLVKIFLTEGAAQRYRDNTPGVTTYSRRERFRYESRMVELS